ncbi:hypothetical protein SCUCBS95973_006262 [Sporothrix curviconia]|uniref:F-box domain-containing protein n=1 Tax=Sporothrix curviconia TaxID=1260050 RepID=A0ABP0C434_9PEZI
MAGSSFSSSSASASPSPLSPSAPSSSTAIPPAEALIYPSTSASPRHVAKNVLDLPIEVQNLILGYCSNRDLLRLAVVSRQFHGLATQTLYTKICIDPMQDEYVAASGKKHLAKSSCLDALTTSEYDYARHLQELAVEFDKSGRLAAELGKLYQSHVPTGKMFNTLIVLATRKAAKLESLTWHMPFEISSRLWQTLHGISTLHTVEISMHRGRYCQKPPRPQPIAYENNDPWTTLNNFDPAPAFGAFLTSVPNQHSPTVVGLPPANLFVLPPPHPTQLGQGDGGLVSSIGMHASSSANNGMSSVSGNLPAKAVHGPRSFSGFKHLRSLSVLDINDLTITSEIQECIQNCTRTLSQLKLSLTTELSNAARDPIKSVIAPSSSDALQQAEKNALKLLARMENEAALARIFGITMEKQDLGAGGQDGRGALSSNDGASNKDSTRGSDKGKAPELSAADNYLLNSVPGTLQAATSDLDPNADTAVWEDRKKTALAQISRIFDEYMEMKAEKRTAKAVAPSDSSADGSKPVSEDKLSADDGVSLSWGSPEKTSTTSSSWGRADGDDILPDDIDIEAPEGQLDLHPHDGAEHDTETGTEKDADEAPAKTTAAGELATSEDICKPLEGLASPAPVSSDMCSEDSTEHGQHESQTLTSGPSLVEHLRQLDALHEALDKELSAYQSFEHARQEPMVKLQTSVSRLRKDIDSVIAEAATYAAGQTSAKKNKRNKRKTTAEEDTQALSSDAAIDFARSTRGLALESFSCLLMPVQASVLRKALDLSCLLDLTLLNVGPQSAIWIMFSKQNAASNLPLRSVRTDNVTMSCLTCLGSLRALEKVYLVEKGQHTATHKNPANKTTVGIRDIRELVLRVHAAKLKVVSICSDSSEAWDLDDKTIRMLSRHATNLRELAGSITMAPLHTLMQRLDRFESLLALHIVQLHNDDTCIWAMQAVKDFIADILTHRPNLKFEYLAVGDAPTAYLVERTVAKEQATTQPAGTTANGGSTGEGGLSANGEDADAAANADADVDADASSDDEESSPRLVAASFKPRQIDSISGISIFQKKIRNGEI